MGSKMGLKYKISYLISLLPLDYSVRIPRKLDIPNIGIRLQSAIPSAWTPFPPAAINAVRSIGVIPGMYLGKDVPA